MSELLSETEIKTVTGYDQAAKQCQSLQEHGVFFIKDRYGCPHTTWYNLNHPSHLRTLGLGREEPDFSSLGG